jgi:hypothetical protein
MGEKTMTALRPFKRETMVNQYGEDPNLLERRQRRSQLADDLLEDIVDDSELDDTADESGGHSGQYPLAYRDGGVGRGAGQAR